MSISIAKNNAGLALLDAMPPLGSLDAYISWTRSLPVLNAGEERELTDKLYSNNDLVAARQLVLTHLRFVVRIAQGYYGYGLPLEDLIQVGNIGLMKAVKRFDPAVGVRLMTFAVHWIKAEIHEFVLRNWRIVKVATTKAQRKLFFNLRKLMHSSHWLSDKEVKHLAKELHVSSQDVQVMEGRLLSHDVAFSVREESGDGADDGRGHAAGSGCVDGAELYLSDESSNPYLQLAESNWEDDRVDKLTLALSHLDARSKDILQQRWLQEPKATLHDLSLKYGVSLERIRQIEERAIQRVKGYLSGALSA